MPPIIIVLSGIVILILAVSFKTNAKDRNTVAGYMFSRGTKWGVLMGMVTGAIIGFPIFIVGALPGIVIGGFVGIFVGMVNGLIAGLVTILFFYPLKDTLVYRTGIGIVCFIGSALFTFIGSLYVEDVWSRQTIWFILPIVCAALFAIPISQKLASWYIEQ